MANFTPMMQSIGVNNILAGHDSPVVLQSLFYPSEIYTRTCGQLALDVFWYGDTFSGTYEDRRYSGIRTLDVAATLNNTHNQLVVYVVNQSKDEAMETTISLASGEFADNVKVSIINGPDIKSENTIEKPNQVGVKETDLKVSGKSFAYTFEPHSVTALVCSVN
jgi:alpha-L-arabinofuranosidase